MDPVDGSIPNPEHVPDHGTHHWMVFAAYMFFCWELESEASILQRGASDVDILRAKDSRSVQSIHIPPQNSVEYGILST